MHAVQRRTLFFLAGVAAISGLAGCAQTSDKVVSHDSSANVPSPIVPPPPTAKPEVRHANVDDKLKLEVIGLDRNAIEARLGAPSQEVQQSPAVEAIFRQGQCVLSVTLYPDVQTRIYHALAYKVTSNADSVKERQFCSAIFDARFHDKPVVDRATYTTDHGR
jgi:hypothetical protein